MNESHESLWPLASAPLVWALHLLASYITAAIYCQKLGGSLAPVRGAIAGYTVLALLVLAFFGVRGYRRQRAGSGAAPPTHSFDTPTDRHRFLGLAALLLSGLSAVAVVYQALPAVFIGSCR